MENISSIGPDGPTETSREPAIHIQVRMPQPWKHQFEVAMTLSGFIERELDLVMPTWTPGSYLIREYSRHVQQFSATTGSGKELRWHKKSKNRWCILKEQASNIIVRYRVYAFEVSVRGCFLDDSRGYISGAGLFMFVHGYLDKPYRIHIEPDPSWKHISTALEPLRSQPGSFLAPDFDTLLDCPIEIGNQEILAFQVGGIPHRVSLYGEGNYDAARLCEDMRRIVETAIQVVGEIPFSHYTFLVQLQPDGNSGIEHSNSCSLQVSRWSFQTEEGYQKFLTLVAHEYFHLWNVKRIRPQALGPFDYSEENYTHMLWVSEGFTEYYDDLIVRRSGLMQPGTYLKRLSSVIQTFQETPGRLLESAADASFDAWIKSYRQNENTANASVSYYTKGSLIALVMDLEIRHRTENRTLDDVMRLLYQSYHRDLNRGFTDAEFRTACEEVAGGNLDEIFDGYAYGTEEIDFARYFGYAGLKFEDSGEDDEASAQSYLGITAGNVEGSFVVLGVTAGGPAYEQGINVRDEIIAMDGFRVNSESLSARIKETPPGSRLEILVSRAGKMRIIPVVTERKSPKRFRLSRIQDPALKQKLIFEEWLAAPWEPTR
jgi:predicted metalloprotease with PDZ domain